MSISLGTSALTDLRLGSSKVSAAYLGTSIVYQTSSAAPWTPADLTGLKYYFTAGAGVTLVSGRVSQWTDQVSSLAMTNPIGSSSAYWPQYVSSETLANNKPALYFSSGSARTTERLQALVTTGIADSDNLTVIGIVIPNSSADGNYQIYGGIGSTAGGYNYQNALWIDSPSTNNEWGRFNNQSGGGANGNASSGVAVTSNSVSWHAVVYDSAAGTIKQYVNSSTVAQTTTGAPTNPSKAELKLIAGDYSDGSNIGGLGIINGKILELIYTTAIPTTTELDNLSNYVSTYY